MKNSSIVLLTLLLILSLLNYDYANLSPLQFTMSNIVDIIIILCCVGTLKYSVSNGVSKPKTTN